MANNVAELASIITDGLQSFSPSVQTAAAAASPVNARDVFAYLPELEGQAAANDSLCLKEAFCAAHDNIQPIQQELVLAPNDIKYDAPVV